MYAREGSSPSSNLLRARRDDSGRIERTIYAEPALPFCLKNRQYRVKLYGNRY